jgi:hydrogenase maturation protease
MASRLELTLLTDFQLQVEHVLDLKDQDLVLLVDAHLTTPPPFCFERVAPDPVPSFSTHWVSPGTLLKVAQDLQDKPPPTYLLGIRGYQYELGDPLTAEAQAHLEDAIRQVLALLDHPASTFWDTLLDPPCSEIAHADDDSSSPSPTSILVQDA